MSSPNPDFSRPTCRVCLHNNSDQEMSSIFDLDADLGDIFIYEKIEQCAGIEVRLYNFLSAHRMKTYHFRYYETIASPRLYAIIAMGY